MFKFRLVNSTMIQKMALPASDMLSMAAAFLIAIATTQFYHHDLSASPWNNFFHLGVSKLLGLLILAIFWYQEQYHKRRPFGEELLQIYRVIGIFILINLGLSFVMAKGSLKILILSFWLLFAAFVPLLRSLVKLLLLRLNLWQRDLYILGHGETAFEAYHLFVKNTMMGYRLRAFVNPDETMLVRAAHLPAPIISLQQMLGKIKEQPDCEVIVALSNLQLNRQVGLINYLQHNCLAVLILPEISGLALYGAQIEHFFANDQLVLRLKNNLARSMNKLIKRSFDLLLVTVGLLVLLPFFIIIALAIKLSTHGRIFYSHKRVGQHGKPFYCLKFQTMYPNSAELLHDLFLQHPNLKEEWERDFKIKQDPRVTPIGRWLRKTSLDELPQLLNVLKGEMSLVGPRPIVAEEIERYEDGFYYYQLVLPGITGLWQISGRNDVDYKNRVRLDEWYVKNWSLWYDLGILAQTIIVVVKRNGAY